KDLRIAADEAESVTFLRRIFAGHTTIRITPNAAGRLIWVNSDHGRDDARVTKLALKAGRGDRKALTEFIRSTQDDVWRMLAHLGGPEIADDLTQETYLRSEEHTSELQSRFDLV